MIYHSYGYKLQFKVSSVLGRTYSRTIITFVVLSQIIIIIVLHSKLYYTINLTMLTY